jgi:hypothetical protein
MRGRRSTLLFVTTLLPALAWAGACGKLKPADTSGAGGGGGGGGTPAGAAGSTTVLVDISGVAAPHPLNHALGADADFSNLRVAIVDPQKVIADPAATPLGSMNLDTSTGNCDATTMACKWKLSGVDITRLTLGLVGTLEDLRTGDGGDARLWVKTGTGMGTADDLKAVRAAPAPITDRRAFVVSRKLEAKLGAFLGPVLNTTFAPGDLEARGFLIGHIVGKLSEGPMPAGLAGATVAATGDFDIVYPKDDFSGVGASTGANGLFLMVPKKLNEPIVTMWDVVPPASETRTWGVHIAGSNPGNAFVIIMPANE